MKANVSFHTEIMKLSCSANRSMGVDPANNYLFKVINTNTRKRCEISSKLKTPERRHWCHPDVFIVNVEHISHLFSNVSIVDFEHVNVFWGILIFNKLNIVGGFVLHLLSFAFAFKSNQIRFKSSTRQQNL